MHPAPARTFVDQADRLHDQALASAMLRQRDLNEYVQLLGDRLSDAAHDVIQEKVANSFFSSLQFHIVDTPVINVFTTGGRHIYIYEGLIQFCENEEELAAAVAHVYAHAVNRDIEKLPIKPNPKLPLDLVAWQFVAHRFTADQEAAADRLAFSLYVAAGWDPGKFENLYQRCAIATPAPPLPIASHYAHGRRRRGRGAGRRHSGKFGPMLPTEKALPPFAVRQSPPPAQVISGRAWPLPDGLSQLPRLPRPARRACRPGPPGPPPAAGD